VAPELPPDAQDSPFFFPPAPRSNQPPFIQPARFLVESPTPPPLFFSSACAAPPFFSFGADHATSFFYLPFLASGAIFFPLSPAGVSSIVRVFSFGPADYPFFFFFFFFHRFPGVRPFFFFPYINRAADLFRSPWNADTLSFFLRSRQREPFFVVYFESPMISIFSSFCSNAERAGPPFSLFSFLRVALEFPPGFYPGTDPPFWPSSNRGPR